MRCRRVGREVPTHSLCVHLSTDRRQLLVTAPSSFIDSAEGACRDLLLFLLKYFNTVYIPMYIPRYTVTVDIHGCLMVPLLH